MPEAHHERTQETEESAQQQHLAVSSRASHNQTTAQTAARRDNRVRDEMQTGIRLCRLLDILEVVGHVEDDSELRHGDEPAGEGDKAGRAVEEHRHGHEGFARDEALDEDEDDQRCETADERADDELVGPLALVAA